MLASAAIVVMCLLVIARVLNGWRRSRHLAARRLLAPMLLEGAAGEDALRRIPDRVVTDLSLELIQLVRGAEREAFIANATRLGVPKRLARRLRTGSPRDRALALQGLALFDHPAALTALRGALDDRDREIRFAAAQALVAKGEPLRADSLVQRLQLGSAQSARATVSLFRTIAQARPEEIKALVMQREQNLEVRIAAIEALAETGDYSMVPVIAELGRAAADGTEELPRYLHALGKLGHPSARRTVIGALSSESMAARAAAARAAGRIALVESADRLAELLDDPEWWVRFRAAEALIELGTPGLDLLRAAAAGEPGAAQDAAATMLAERGIAP